MADTLGDRRADDPAGSVEAQETKYLLSRPSSASASVSGWSSSSTTTRA
ncbi:hypothetical protein ACFS33_19620 [Cellulomonas phragmiteti]